MTTKEMRKSQRETSQKTYWVSISQHRIALGSYAHGAAASSQHPGGEIEVRHATTADSQALLGKEVAERAKAALKERTGEGRPALLIIAPFDLKRHLEHLLPRRRENNDWDHPDCDIWRDLDDVWQRVDGTILTPRDEADRIELDRLHVVASQAAKKDAP